jgi:hypothetical protein
MMPGSRHEVTQLKAERGGVGKMGTTPRHVPGLTVALDTPSARILAGQASIVHDLQFVMDCCKRLLAELARPEEDRDGVVPLALWSSALVAYARCFGKGSRYGLGAEDVRDLPLQGAVMKFHEWVIEERDKLTEHPADPFDAAKVGAALSPGRAETARVEGIAIFSTSRVLIDATGVRQLGGLASELAKQTAGKAQGQQDSVLSDAQQLDIRSLYELPPLSTQRRSAGDMPQASQPIRAERPDPDRPDLGQH